MLVKHAWSGGKCLLEWVPKSSRAKPSLVLELEPRSRAALWLHNVPCERGWPSPISTVSFQLGPFPPPPPSRPLPAGGFSNPLTSGEALGACAPNPKMAGLTLTCVVTLQRRQGLLCLLTPGSHFLLLQPKWKKCVCVYAGPSFHKVCHYGR